MKLQITQFMRPDGRPVDFEIDIPNSYKDKIDLLTKNGLTVTCEQLRTLEVAQYLTHKDGDVSIVISLPGVDPRKALLGMIDEFTQEKFDEFLQEVS